MSPLSFSTPIFIRKKNTTSCRASAQLAADKLGYPIVFAGEAQKPAGWIRELKESLWKENAVRSVIGNACCRRLRKRGNGGFRFFTTSLLYSRYQHHEAICLAAKQVARETGISFLYRDFRPYWYDGINLSKELGLYRQKWCGCLLSRKEAEIQRARRAELKRQKALARMAALS